MLLDSHMSAFYALKVYAGWQPNTPCSLRVASLALTLYVDESLGLNLSWDVQAGSKQPLDGSQVSELPVSKQPVNCFGGVPSRNSP